MAIIIGVGAGLGAIAFRYLILWFTMVFTGHWDYSASGHQINPLFPPLGTWFVVLVPVVGGLVYGPLIQRFAKEARGHGVPEVMLAVAKSGGRIRARVAVVKSLASAICIGSGGSVGREGPIVQIGSALGSAFGQAMRLPESILRLLVACGAAGGISATFNAPIAGVMFALELILRDFEAGSFGVVVLSSVAASVVGRTAFGSSAFLPLPAFELVSRWEYLLFAGLGLVSALVGVTFIHVLYATEDFIDRVWRGPDWSRPATGGVVLGLLLMALPQMYGVGYPVMERAIRGDYLVPLLLVLLGGKIVATSLTIGIGGSGGVFAPSMFMGAMMGTAYGRIAGMALPHVTGAAGAYGLVGMGAVFAAAARAPITSVLIVFELTNEYKIILPLLFSVAVATGIGRVLARDTIYTTKLRRHGVDLRSARSPGPMESLHVGEAMQPVPAALPEELSLADAVGQFSRDRQDAFPVIDPGGSYRGTITARIVDAALSDSAANLPIGRFAQSVPTLTIDQTLAEALSQLVHDHVSGLPVLGADGRTVVGWLSHRDVLRAYQVHAEHQGMLSSGSHRSAPGPRMPSGRGRL
jgi:CIC family chloride channel protein